MCVNGKTCLLCFCHKSLVNTPSQPRAEESTLGWDISLNQTLGSRPWIISNGWFGKTLDLRIKLGTYLKVSGYWPLKIGVADSYIWSLGQVSF